MSRKNIQLLIFLAALLMVGLAVTQFFWVKNAYSIEQKQFSLSVKDALSKVVQDIQEHSGDSGGFREPLVQKEPNFYLVKTHDTLHPFYLKSLLESRFLEYDIREGFQYRIYDCFTDSITHKDVVFAGSDRISETEIQSPDFHADDNEGHYFSIYFFERGKSIWSKMHFWVYSSVLVLTVILFFTFTIHIILKQKKLSEIKNDFINNMTHEFKTPLSTIDLSVKSMLRNDPAEKPEKFKRYASIISIENERLQKRVERILEIAQIENKKLTLEHKPVDMHELIYDCTESFKPLIEEQNGVLNLSLNASEHTVIGDKVHLGNLLNNLVDNAVKYSGTRPEVTIKTQNSNKMLSVEICDNGSGIAPNEQKKIFDKFYRVNEGNQHDIKGFGIGLNYVKVIAEAHDGKVFVKSESGKGSVFSIFFPNPDVKS